MPPRHSYWTILIDGVPTAFRAATREELLPTLKQLQRKTPTAVMKWFARGRVWESPAEATIALRESARLRRPRHAPGRPGQGRPAPGRHARPRPRGDGSRGRRGGNR